MLSDHCVAERQARYGPDSTFTDYPPMRVSREIFRKQHSISQQLQLTPVALSDCGVRSKVPGRPLPVVGHVVFCLELCRRHVHFKNYKGFMSVTKPGHQFTHTKSKERRGQSRHSD